MGQLKLEGTLGIREAAQAHGLSEAFIRKYIRLGAIAVVHFAGKPVKPYQIVAKDLKQLFTVAASSSLKTREVAKILGRKPSTKEEFLWPE